MKLIEATRTIHVPIDPNKKTGLYREVQPGSFALVPDGFLSSLPKGSFKCDYVIQKRDKKSEDKKGK